MAVLWTLAVCLLWTLVVPELWVTLQKEETAVSLYIKQGKMVVV